MADARDWPFLLGPCGDARKYFKDATSGAAWVDTMCDRIVAALLDKNPAPPTTPTELGMLNQLVADPITRKVRITRNVDMRWELAVDFRDVGAWAITIDETIGGAIVKLYDQEQRSRNSYKMKQLEPLNV